MSTEWDDPRPLAEWLLAQQHPATTDWASEDTRRAVLADDMADDLSMLTDLDLATWRRDLFAPDQPAGVMLNSWVTEADDLQAMLSMRYESGDPARPFVDASILRRAPQTQQDLAGIAGAATSAYGVLGPRHVRVWSCHPVHAFAGTTADKRFLAAPLEQLRKTTLPSNLSASRTDGLSHYDDARAAYHWADAAHPGHPRQAALESREALVDAISRGLLFDILVDNTWAGYVAARSGGRLGLPGFTVQELVLAPHARGHSLGRFLSPLLARSLPSTDGVLIGTIHHDNVGALDAARRAGRVDIGGWFNVPLR